MEKTHAARFFLGANSRYGFHSLYDDFTDLGGGDFLWVIKGGPGCGKSSFMKKIGAAAEQNKVPVEYILCSGDPDSLDGIWLPTLRTGYVDGTAPHVIEAQYPGSASLYLDLGTFYDAGALEQRHRGIVALNKKYKDQYQDAYACLSAAGDMRLRGVDPLFGERQRAIIERRTDGIAQREFHAQSGPACTKTRFLSAITCRGKVLLSQTAEELCERIYTIDNELGMARHYLASIARKAETRGISAILCPDPLDPDYLQAVLLPELSLGFLAVSADEPYEGKVYRHVRLDAIADKEAAAQARPGIRRCKKLCSHLLDCAMGALSQAKALHDELEQVYNPCVDFDGLYRAAQDHISWLFPA